jgi:hypothetical protein
MDIDAFMKDSGPMTLFVMEMKKPYGIALILLSKATIVTGKQNASNYSVPETDLNLL